MSLMTFPGGRVVPATVLADLAVRHLTGTADPAAIRALAPRDRAQFRFWVEVLDWALTTKAVARSELWARRGGAGGPLDVVLSVTRMQALAQACVMARAAAPQSCGPEIAAAPARGAALRFQPVAMVPKGAEGFAAEPAGYRGRDAVRRADLFDKMDRAAQRRGQAAPFSPGQVLAGRSYAALAEFVSAGGVKCSSLEGRIGGGAGGLDWIERHAQAAARLARMQARIGPGAALSVRRVRPRNAPKRAARAPSRTGRWSMVSACRARAWAMCCWRMVGRRAGRTSTPCARRWRRRWKGCDFALDR
ncbi:hypothetical protein [Rhodobacter capsulatus]|uniref:hypothetical protein n=1 Tax=Rhodobacter capsulatus TaxID=1061 RepID=UPI0040292AB7